MQLFLLLLCLNNWFSLNAQDEKRANIWYFNNEAGINFNTISPSPLTDGQNDVFRLFSHPEFEGIIRDFKIFDRWGNLIFKNQESTIEPIEWRREFKNQVVPEGTYLYLITIEYIDGELVSSDGEIYVSYWIRTSIGLFKLSCSSY